MNLFSLTMPKVGFLLFVLALSFSSSAEAQDKDWRPISPAELSAKTPVVEPDADAEALFWEVRIDDSSSDDVSRKHYVRVKIFTERGREKFSKFDIPFTKRTKIKDLAARVIKADGSIVDIGKNDIFEREIVRANGVKIKAKSFAIPNIEPGVIVEYRYKETTEDAGASGMRLQFQRDIPVQNLAYYYRPYKGEPRYQIYNFSGTKFNKDRDGYYLAQRTNVPALKSEPRMPPEDTVRPWMLLTSTGLGIASASAFQITFTLKDPSSPALYWGGVATEWAGVNKLMEKPSDDIKKATAQILTGVTSPDEKLIKIYQFCQKEIANTTFDSSITADQRAKLPEVKSANDVLKKKSGNAMYIDILFGAMATAAGFEARVALLGDRSEILFNPKMTNDSFVTPGGVGILVGDNWKVFNPGSRFAPYGMLPWYEEGSWAMLVGPKEYVWRETPFTNHVRSNKKRSAKFNLLEDGTLEGDVTMEYTGHPALTYRLDNYDEAPATRESNLKDEITGQLSTAEVSGISIENLEDSGKPLIFKYKVRVPNYAQKTGKRLFLQPGYFEYSKNAVFAAADRKYDIVFPNPWSDTDDIDITWPKGYDLDNADVPAEQGDAQGISSLKTKVEVAKADRLMKYHREFYFGGGGNVLFDASVYPVLKRLFDQFHTANSHTITFKQL
ncbi:MAG: DUF3857 and transglutaminase domain-containing protein [Pyrinomonadaceae bacterium]